MESVCSVNKDLESVLDQLCDSVPLSDDFGRYGSEHTEVTSLCNVPVSTTNDRSRGKRSSVSKCGYTAATAGSDREDESPSLECVVDEILRGFSENLPEANAASSGARAPSLGTHNDSEGTKSLEFEERIAVCVDELEGVFSTIFNSTDGEWLDTNVGHCGAEPDADKDPQTRPTSKAETKQVFTPLQHTEDSDDDNEHRPNTSAATEPLEQILLNPLAVVVSAFQTWLSDNKSVLSSDEVTRYQRQLNLHIRIMKLLEKSHSHGWGPGASESDDTADVENALSELRALGDPPPAVLNDCLTNAVKRFESSTAPHATRLPQARHQAAGKTQQPVGVEYNDDDNCKNAKGGKQRVKGEAGKHSVLTPDHKSLDRDRVGANKSAGEGLDDSISDALKRLIDPKFLTKVFSGELNDEELDQVTAELNLDMSGPEVEGRGDDGDSDEGESLLKAIRQMSTLLQPSRRDESEKKPLHHPSSQPQALRSNQCTNHKNDATTEQREAEAKDETMRSLSECVQM